jgi:hypothetical protein
MQSENQSSYLKTFFEVLGAVWSAGGQAVQLKKELNVSSLRDTAAVAERVGCVVCYADLPKRVSGFAEIIEGKSHIVLNRAKPRKDLEYTLSHELGHHVLHLNPPSDTAQVGFLTIGTAEFQADLFAATWIMWLGNKRQRKEVLLENPEFAVVVSCLIATILLALITLFAHVCSKFFRPQSATLPEAK